MTLTTLKQMFNRACRYAFSMKKFFCLFLTLILSGLVFLFFQGIAIYAPLWLKWPLKCVPLFVIIGFLMAAGALLTQIYHKQINGEEESIKGTLFSSWELVFKASYLALPLLLAFLVFWILLGVFMLLKAIPYLGTFFGIILAFAPFLLNLGTLLLFLVALGMFFFLTPELALNKHIDRKQLVTRLTADLFSNLLLLVVAFVPVWVVWFFIGKAAWLTFEIYSTGDAPYEIVLQSFFMMLPFLAILTPVINFFFNFSLEAYLWVTEGKNRSSQEHA